MKTKPKLTDFFTRNFPLNKEGLDVFVASFEKAQYAKGDILLRPNTSEGNIRFILDGYVREYYATESKEVNTNFYGASQFAMDLNSFFDHSKTNKWQDCLTDVTALTLSKDKLDILLEKYNCAHDAIRLSFQKALAAKESLEHKRITKSTEDLYKEIQVKRPDWLKNIPQYHIASYLKVTPETLSRIRKRIY